MFLVVSERLTKSRLGEGREGGREEEKTNEDEDEDEDEKQRSR